ncbi:MAG: preprotein translocase subunit SecE [Brevundimonas sp.]|uniref:preprotein translocase subunit SecE n=1 Tax=Brevundimonas sp. TaxID=1871086 RepID=UPI00403468A8
MAKAKTPGKRPSIAAKAQASAKAMAAPAGQTVTVDTPAPKKKTSIPQFFQQVQAEARKIVWPSRKETWITSVMVFIMVALATVFFWIVDFVLAKISTWLLALG